MSSLFKILQKQVKVVITTDKIVGLAEDHGLAQLCVSRKRQNLYFILGLVGPSTYSPYIRAGCNYCKYGSDNTYCQYGQKPNPDTGRCGKKDGIKHGVSKAEIKEILAIHNDLRR